MGKQKALLLVRHCLQEETGCAEIRGSDRNTRRLVGIVENPDEAVENDRFFSWKQDSPVVLPGFSLNASDKSKKEMGLC
jgi:hypothetical protein